MSRLTYTFCPKRIHRRRRFSVIKLKVRDHYGFWQSVIHQCSGDELAGFIVNNFFKHGLADRLNNSSMHLTRNQHRINLLAAIIDCDVALEMDLAGFRINIHHGDVRAERET